MSGHEQVECQFSVEKVEGQRHRMSKTSEIWRHVYIRAADQAQAGQVLTANYRPKPLLGLIYCRRLRRWATAQTAAYHVGSRRRHAFLFSRLSRTFRTILLHSTVLCRRHCASSSVMNWLHRFNTTSIVYHFLLTFTLSRDYNCDSTTIRPRSDYDVSRAPIYSHSTRFDASKN